MHYLKKAQAVWYRSILNLRQATSTEPLSPKKSKGEQKLLSLLSDVISTDSDVTAGSNVKQEIARYTGGSQYRKAHWIDWWRVNK